VTVMWTGSLILRIAKADLYCRLYVRRARRSVRKHGCRSLLSAVAARTDDDELTLTADSDADVTSLSSSVKAATDRADI